MAIVLLSVDDVVVGIVDVVDVDVDEVVADCNARCHKSTIVNTLQPLIKR